MVDLERDLPLNVTDASCLMRLKKQTKYCISCMTSLDSTVT
jgi:hypothetical protein